MSDRELLEKAAMAAGIELKGWTNISGNEEAVIGYDAYSVETWNPLTDDGDALRLAVKLRINFSDSALWLTHNDQEHYDPYAATRMVIVRAAAAIHDAKGQQ